MHTHTHRVTRGYIRLWQWRCTCEAVSIDILSSKHVFDEHLQSSVQQQQHNSNTTAEIAAAAAATAPVSVAVTAYTRMAIRTCMTSVLKFNFLTNFDLWNPLNNHKEFANEMLVAKK